MITPDKNKVDKDLCGGLPLLIADSLYGNNNIFGNGGLKGPVYVSNEFGKYWVNANGHKLSSNKKYYWRHGGKGYTIYGFDGIARKYNTQGKLIDSINGTRAKYIGSNAKSSRQKQKETRQKYFNADKELRDSTNVIAKRYGLNPSLLGSRFMDEGVGDEFINQYNRQGGQGNSVKSNAIKQYDYDADTPVFLYDSSPYKGLGFIDGYLQFGLDTSGSDYMDGSINVKEPWVVNNMRYGNGEKGTIEIGSKSNPDNIYDINEKGVTVFPTLFKKWSDGMSIMAAELAAKRAAIKKAYPQMSDKNLDAAAMAAYNMGKAKIMKKYNKSGRISPIYYPYITFPK